MIIIKITELTDNASRCLNEQCFTASTIYINYQRHWNSLIKSTDIDANFSLQLVNDYLIKKFSINLLLKEPFELTLKQYRVRQAFKSLIYFYKFNSMPGTSKTSATIQIKLSDFDSSCLNSYIDYIKDLDYSQNSIKYNYNIIHNYLVAFSLVDFSRSNLMNYLNSLSRLAKSTVKSTMKVLKRFLCYCYKMDFIKLDCSLLFPSNKSHSYTEIPSVYTPEEIFQLLEYIKNNDSSNKKRNYAIVVLIAVYGIRAGDILKMKLSDINWENETICIVQSKTKKLLMHKLTCHTGNALTDYLLNERAKSKKDKLFLKADGSEIKSSVTISTMIFTAFINSNININGRKHGSHSLRHSLASNMLSNDVSILEISKTLGHSSVDSTKIYSKVDIKHLRLCELEVPYYE